MIQKFCHVCIAQAHIKRKKYRKGPKDIVALADDTRDRSDNCQLVSVADSTSGEKCHPYLLLSQHVYLYSGVKSKEVFMWPCIDHIGWRLSPVARR